MFAVCAKKETKTETPGMHEIRDQMFQQKFGVKAKHYLEDLRRAAMIEYKMPEDQVTKSRSDIRAAAGIDARRARRDRPRPRACGLVSPRRARHSDVLYCRRRGFSTPARRASRSRRSDRHGNAGDRGREVFRGFAGRGHGCRGERRARPAGSVECAGRDRVHPPRRRPMSWPDPRPPSSPTRWQKTSSTIRASPSRATPNFLATLVQQATGKSMRPVMMLWSPELAVVPVTIHLPLRQIFQHLSTELVVETGRIVARDLAARFRHCAAAPRRRRPQSPRRRRRRVRRGGPRHRRAGGRAASCRRHRCAGPAAGGLAVP